jgi:hypothetical protein
LVMLVVGCLCVAVCVMVFAVATGVAAESCPNEAFRTGASASLPDCRAYELVTPADKGRTQALTFTGDAKAAISSNGERVALQTIVPFGPNPSLAGARAIFSRTSTGWEMGSAVASQANGYSIEMRLFSPDLSQVAFESETGLNFGDVSENVAFEVGAIGGKYALVASIPREEVANLNTQFLGASGDFGHVLLTSIDHELLSGAEGAAAEATDSGALDLYDWSDGHLQLINIKKDDSLVNQCGATLGAGGGSGASKDTIHAVSEDGSKVFFTVPGKTSSASGPGCGEPTRLYMRIAGGEPVEVSAPEPGITPSEVLPVRYNYATPDGSKVFFNTETALTSDDTSKANKLFEYDTEAPAGTRLKRIASNVPTTKGVGPGSAAFSGYFFAEDGSVVYTESERGDLQEIDRYDTTTGKRTFVAMAHIPEGAGERSYSTSNGEFFLFPSQGVEDEPRGVGHEELYRYDHASESVMCVTCGSGSVVPTQGGDLRVSFKTVLETEDETPALTQISEDGQEVFFQTTAQLVPQDTNSTIMSGSSTNETPGLDVYEWEAEGAQEAPGVFCRDIYGCTHLLSSGEAVGPARLLGASTDGRDVFFESAARLVPQDTDEFPDIYDARVGGGFAPMPAPPECLSCQGVGSPPPLFSPGASGSFMGAGNPATRVVEERPKSKKKKRRSNAKGRHKRRRGRKLSAAVHHGRGGVK